MRIGRNQYLIAPSPTGDIQCDRMVPWDGMCVYLGAGCSVTRQYRGKDSLLLLGYGVDPDAPEQDEHAMCARVLETPDDEKARAVTDSWGGRWVICLRRNGRLRVWTDACGLKQVFYHRESGYRGYLASQARYLAMILGDLPDAGALAYLEKAKRKDREYAWPLDGTAYGRIRRLLPNHVLDDASWEPRRMGWPAVSDTDAQARVWRILTGGMTGLLNRGPAAVSVTAGLDSRLVLAAASRCPQHIRAFTFRYDGMAEEHVDLTVAQRLCAQMGISHRIIACGQPDEDFRCTYMAHAEDGHEYWIQMAEALARSSCGELILVKGSCNEINSNPAGLLPDALINAGVLCRLFGIPWTPFSAGIVRKWLADARVFCKNSGVRLLDLFYWEHRCGSWLAACLNEQDIAGEMYSPFNVRTLMAVIRPVPVQARIPPDYSFFRDLLRRGERDWLALPINPGRYDAPAARWKIALKYGLFSGRRSG